MEYWSFTGYQTGRTFYARCSGYDELVRWASTADVPNRDYQYGCSLMKEEAVPHYVLEGPPGIWDEWGYRVYPKGLDEREPIS